VSRVRDFWFGYTINHLLQTERVDRTVHGPFLPSVSLPEHLPLLGLVHHVDEQLFLLLQLPPPSRFGRDGRLLTDRADSQK